MVVGLTLILTVGDPLIWVLGQEKFELPCVNVHPLLGWPMIWPVLNVTR
jgi:hypothetical protein